MGMLFTRPAWRSQCVVTVRELGDAACTVLGGQLKGVFQIGQEVEKQRAWK